MSPERSEEEAQREKERFGSERESIYFVEFLFSVQVYVLFTVFFTHIVGQLMSRSAFFFFPPIRSKFSRVRINFK